MVKQCQNCKIEFEITADDSAFYQKISVPPPTWCPECRMIRRMCFRNARTIYKRTAKGVEGEIFSSLPPESPMNVYEEGYWHSDAWNAMDYGKDYDFSRPFFEQVKELIFSVPWASTYRVYSINSDYSFNIDGLKDCYFLFNSGFSESCLYGMEVSRSRECVENTNISGCELSYELMDCEKCYRCFFSSHCVECSDIYFCSDLVDCRNCFGCVNLKHTQYCVFNEQYSKEAYEKFLHERELGSYGVVSSFRKRAAAHAIQFPVRYMRGTNNSHVTGDYIDHSKNVRNSFICEKLDTCAHCQLILFMPSKDSSDMTAAAGELCYEVEEAGGYNVHFSWYMRPKNLKSGQINQTDEEYCVNCSNSSDLFGCVGVSNKKYCILNKQYSKESFNTLKTKIIEHMNTMPYVDAHGRTYRYGEFFSPELSPFAYNETIAQEYFPLTKEQAVAQGYRWRDAEERNYRITKKSADLPDRITDVPDSIADEVIGCVDEGACMHECTTAFRIVPRELEFYRRMSIPLPRLCPNCRHHGRLKQRNPLKLWHRTCTCRGEGRGKRIEESGGHKNTTKHFHGVDPCPNEFETSYAPDRLEIVYCEQCYNAEVA